jgi:polysaccharide export outer membrane protein
LQATGKSFFIMQRYVALVFFLFPLFFSCANSRKVTYFPNLQDSVTFNEMEVPDHVIQKNDVLSISVNSIDPEASKMFNLPNQSQVRSSTPTGDVMEPGGYLVNKDGFIRFLMLGTVKAEGLTKEQLQTAIRNSIIERKLLLDPVVEVRHLNYKVTVLGEVSRPTVISVPNEKITLLEALGLAGDMTIFAKRTNVLVIRTESGKRVTNRIDLNSTELFDSPYYYLKPNDVVYVEPNKARAMSASRLNQLLPAIVSGLSVLVVVIDRLTR